MAELLTSLGYFLFSLGIGVILFLPVVKLKETGVGFGKLILSVGGISQVIAVGIFSFLNSDTWNWGLLNLSVLIGLFLVVVNYFLFSREEKEGGINKISFIVFCMLLIGIVKGLDLNEGQTILYNFATVLFIGCTTFAMLLGHYYLVVPKLSERPLIVLHYLLWTFLIIKIGFSAYSYFSLSDEHKKMWDLLFISMRFLWGYFAIGLLSYFSFRLSRMRSTQSATGVLYVIVFFMIVGELLAYSLNSDRGFFL